MSTYFSQSTAICLKSEVLSLKRYVDILYFKLFNTYRHEHRVRLLMTCKCRHLYWSKIDVDYSKTKYNSVA